MDPSLEGPGVPVSPAHPKPPRSSLMHVRAGWPHLDHHHPATHPAACVTPPSSRPSPGGTTRAYCRREEFPGQMWRRTSAHSSASQKVSKIVGFHIQPNVKQYPTNTAIFFFCLCVNHSYVVLLGAFVVSHLFGIRTRAAPGPHGKVS